MADKKKGVLRDKYSRQPSSSQHYAEVTLESEDGNGAHHIDLGDIVQGVSSSVEQQSLLPNSTSINMPPRDDDNNNDSPTAHLDTAQIKALADKLKALLETLEAVAHPPQPAAPEPEKKYVLSYYCGVLSPLTRIDRKKLSSRIVNNLLAITIAWQVSDAV